MNKQETTKISDYLFMSDSENCQSDLAFIFGTSLWPRPLSIAIDLYRQQRIKKIILTGGINEHTGINEAQEMARVAISQGIPSPNLIIEDKSTNTMENVVFARKLLKELNILRRTKSILAICKNVHSRRAMMTLKNYMPEYIDLKVKTYSFPYGPNKLKINKNNWYLDPVVRQKVIREYFKIPAYLQKGHLKNI